MPFSPLGGFPTVATVVVFTDMSTSGFVFWGSKPRARVAASREMAGTVTAGEFGLCILSGVCADAVPELEESEA